MISPGILVFQKIPWISPFHPGDRGGGCDQGGDAVGEWQQEPGRVLHTDELHQFQAGPGGGKVENHGGVGKK